MEKFKTLITLLTFALAVSGVIVAKGNEEKRRLQTNAYFLRSDGITWGSLTGDAAYFTTSPNPSCTATLRDGNCVFVALYGTQSTTTVVGFNK